MTTASPGRVAVGGSGPDPAPRRRRLGRRLRPSRSSRSGPALDVGDLQVPLRRAQRPDPLGASRASSRSWPSRCSSTRRWYLETDDRYPRFAATVSLFSAAMLLVVLSGDLVLTVVGWEVMGWCSYLLIGHWSRRHSARRAAHKAFLVTRVADIGFVLGVIGLAAGAARPGSPRSSPRGPARPSASTPRPPGPHRRPGAHGLRAPTAPCARCSSRSSSSACSASRPSCPSRTGSPTPWRAPPRPAP